MVVHTSSPSTLEAEDVGSLSSMTARATQGSSVSIKLTNQPKKKRKNSRVRGMNDECGDMGSNLMGNH